MVRASVLNDALVCYNYNFGMVWINHLVYSVSELVADKQNNIVNAERRGKRQVLIRPSSKVVVKCLSVMQKHGECWLALLLRAGHANKACIGRSGVEWRNERKDGRRV
jgi:hypothetical protein